MTTRPKKPFIPKEQHDTLRHEIIALLAEKTLSARDISGEVRIAEKEVLEHLAHIRTALHARGDARSARESRSSRRSFPSGRFHVETKCRRDALQCVSTPPSSFCRDRASR